MALRFRRCAAFVKFGALTAFVCTGALAAAPAAHAAQTTSAHPSAAATRADDLWLEAHFEPAAVYVQAQAIYTLRLYQAIDVRELRLEVPPPALGELRPLGDDRVHETTRGGRRYRVTERRFAVFPFASGEFTLPGAAAFGSVAAPGAAPGTRTAVEVAAPRVALSVRPIPPEADSGTWLPARALSLSETWTPDARELHAGDALQRTVRIEAHGLDASQLPPLDFRAAGFSLHPSPPRLENRFDGAWNVGIREQSWRIVPARSGELVVPEVRVRWWDASAGQPRLATLPARTFPVVRDAAAAPDAAEVPDAAKAQPAANVVGPHEDIEDPARLRGVTSRIGIGLPDARSLAAVAAILAALAATMTAQRRKWQRGAPWRALRAACLRDDPRAALDALLAGGARHWPARPPRSLGEFAAHVADRAARDAIKTLDRHLYGATAERWHGRRLLACIPTLRTRPPFRPPSRAGGLPPLYPE